MSIRNYLIIILTALFIDWSLLVILHDYLSGKSYYKDLLDHQRLKRLSLKELDTKWEQAKEKSDIIVSLTTIPERIDFLELTLKSLLYQKRLPKKIILNIPHQSFRTKKEYSQPNWLIDLKGVEVNRVEIDYGPATKFIPTLEACSDNQLILVVDDDHIYPANYIEEFEQASEKYPDYILAGSGWRVPADLVDRDTTLKMNLFNIPPSPEKGTRLKKIKKTDIIQGYGGYLIKPAFFDLESLKNFPETPSQLRFVDDVWISAHALVDKYIIPLKRFCFSTPWIRKLSKESSLSTINNKGKEKDEDRHNSIAIKYFKDKWNLME
ncbi:hypothetical protein [Ekhidna sp.]|uniref:hypothetical protein n=1 Tax=Ekhidna sp. TaxID=2608089 RepID=UPI003BA9474E